MLSLIELSLSGVTFLITGLTGVETSATVSVSERSSVLTFVSEYSNLIVYSPTADGVHTYEFVELLDVYKSQVLYS